MCFEIRPELNHIVKRFISNVKTMARIFHWQQISSLVRDRCSSSSIELGVIPTALNCSGCFGLLQISFDSHSCRIAFGYVYSFAVTQKLFIVLSEPRWRESESRWRQLRRHRRNNKKWKPSPQRSYATVIHFISCFFFLLSFHWRDNLSWRTRADTNRPLSS